MPSSSVIFVLIGDCTCGGTRHRVHGAHRKSTLSRIRDDAPAARLHSSLLHGCRALQPAMQIADEIVRRLDADRQPQQPVARCRQRAALRDPSPRASSSPDAPPGSRRRRAIRPARSTAAPRGTRARCRRRRAVRSSDARRSRSAGASRSRAPDATAGPGSTPVCTAG